VALAKILHKEGGLYLLNSNTGWSFYDIATALNDLHGKQWVVTPTEDFVYDQRMVDVRGEMPALNHRLPQLPAL
jgi:dTDP-4-dehydrorhamnose reductase